METEGSSTYSQKPANFPYPEPDATSPTPPRPPPIPVITILTSAYRLSLGLPMALFPPNQPPKYIPH
jgi:hypothetical protein